MSTVPISGSAKLIHINKAKDEVFEAFYEHQSHFRINAVNPWNKKAIPSAAWIGFY